MKSEKQLYQWDTNQSLVELTPSAQFVDYPIGDEVIRIKADGTRCRIPDEVLQTYGGKTCYERYPDGTYRAYSFTVLYAPKPPDYVFTPEERTTFEALTARVDSAIEEIKRRADSGEFTPVKGVDYFTDAEKAEMMEGVSSGAVGEFRKVVDSATTEYNDNHNSKLAKYNANAAEKLTTYDTNDEQRTSDYNRNAEVKLEAYNQNHAAKVAEYNQNAETKTAEFDSNAAALQTEVDRLRGECDQLTEENRKQENRIDALIKLNKGQTYDVLEQESEAYSVDVPSGAKYAGIDMVGGKSLVWNQEEFEAMFNADYYPYSEPIIISSQTDRVDVASADSTVTQQITTGFPVLNSAGSVYDYIDLNEGKLHQRVGVKDLGTIDWEQGGKNNKTSWVPVSWKTNVKPVGDNGIKANILCSKYLNDFAYRVEEQVNDKTISVNVNGWVYIYDSAYVSVTPQEFKAAMSGVMLVYEFTKEIITDITIPTELTDWLEVEPGGTVTFKNADESKQLAVPNAVSWVRKLNEVE